MDIALLALVACSNPPPSTDLHTTAHTGASATHTHHTGDHTQGTGLPEDTGPTTRMVEVYVTLDGAPQADLQVYMGGRPYDQVLTDASGFAQLELDLTVAGDHWVLASHPEARIAGGEAPDDEGGRIDLELLRFDPTDNLAYDFKPPGTPSIRKTTEFCAHCHVTINEDWYGSPHRTAASNVHVHDLYAGTAAALSDEAGCETAGGQWWTGIGPGTGAAAQRCYLGEGALPALNDDCGQTAPCDGEAEQTGACADCHAPGIGGTLAGHDLLDAVGDAYDYGVHCDVCHSVESVDLDDPAPGVAGKLHIVRSNEEPSSPLLGQWAPLTFGPLYDVVNPVMGSVQRDLFHQADLCAGCHEYDQPVLVPGHAADPERWPDGTLPVHTTFGEWSASPLGDNGTPCLACHMPPNPEVGNSADLHNVFEDVLIGVSAGWERPPGEVRHHTWVGPRTPDGYMLPLAAALDLSVDTDEDEVIVTATLRNAGAGHALPTGEPLRSLFVLVEARCEDVPLVAHGGDAVPDFGGAADQRTATDGFDVWPGAEPGDRIRMVRRTGAYHDYQGYGPFGDGSFDAEQKGMPVEEVVGSAVVMAVGAGDTVTLDTPLPDGDVAYRVRAPDHLPGEGDEAAEWAGAPGFGYARVLVGPDGTRMVPHFLAVDVASDNRLMPQDTWSSTHRFTGPCDAPSARGVVLYRPFPIELAAERRWNSRDIVATEASR